MELKDTIELMTSKDYKERFKAEYLQLKIRVEGLRQKRYMEEYMNQLEVRAEIEDIELG